MQKKIKILILVVVRMKLLKVQFGKKMRFNRWLKVHNFSFFGE